MVINCFGFYSDSAIPLDIHLRVKAGADAAAVLRSYLIVYSVSDSPAAS
jgi:hypothetical protein